MIPEYEQVALKMLNAKPNQRLNGSLLAHLEAADQLCAFADSRLRYKQVIATLLIQWQALWGPTESPLIKKSKEEK
jgi:hypothetical protein